MTRPKRLGAVYPVYTGVSDSFLHAGQVRANSLGTPGGS